LLEKGVEEVFLRTTLGCGRSGDEWPERRPDMKNWE